MKQSAPRIQYLAERMAHACHCMARRMWQALRCARCRSTNPSALGLRGGARSATQPLTTERPAAQEHLTAHCCGASWGCDGEKVPERQLTTPERDRGEIELAGVREHESSISPTKTRMLLFVNLLASGRRCRYGLGPVQGFTDGVTYVSAGLLASWRAAARSRRRRGRLQEGRG